MYSWTGPVISGTSTPIFTSDEAVQCFWKQSGPLGLAAPTGIDSVLKDEVFGL